MMDTNSQQTRHEGKRTAWFLALLLCVTLLSACSTNPATGKSQFAALMSPAEERRIGAQEHKKIIKQYGLYEDDALQAYVNSIGERVTAKTERPDVDYKFYIIDSPIVNAFALPGGYIYVSRGLLALANNEAELAGVLSHEAGHITARHSAERYSHGVVASLGGTVLSAVLGNKAASQAIGLGSNLYLSGYSRGQENEADSLGLRYMSQGGYNADELSSFLTSLNNDKNLSQEIHGYKEPAAYFSTHPPTPERIQKTKEAAIHYSAPNSAIGRDPYLKKINGLIYGDSPSQGFIRGQNFLHPEMGFKISAPKGYKIANKPTEIVLKSDETKALIIFDFDERKKKYDTPLDYLKTGWVTDKDFSNLEEIKVDDMKAATVSYDGNVNNQPMTIRLVAVEWSKNTYARYQIAIPKGLSNAELDAIKSASYSLRRLSDKEKANLKPDQIKLVTAKFGDEAETLAKLQPFKEHSVDQFRLLNALPKSKAVRAGVRYKVVVRP